MTDYEKEELLKLAAKIDKPKETLELIIKIEEVTKNFSGQIDDLYSAVGMIIVGRFLGWRVMRLASSRRIWSKATELFVDPKSFMPESTQYSRKSVGLTLVDTVGDYWAFIRRHKSISTVDRKGLKAFFE